MLKTIEADATGHPVRTEHTGRIRAHVVYEEADRDAGLALYITGPLITGMVQLPTGAEYDVTEPEILVPVAHIQALHKAIHAEHHRQGRFLSIPIPE